MQLKRNQLIIQILDITEISMNANENLSLLSKEKNQYNHGPSQQREPNAFTSRQKYTHTHIYIYVCVCVCVCVFRQQILL